MTNTDKQRQLALHSAHFIKSASKLSNCPPDEGVEIAFAGRSNAGKSSAINTLTQNRKLARTSKTPGRTQLINFFGLNIPGKRLVDLPGYGFAKVALSVRQDWQKHLDEYLRLRKSLAGLVLIMDIRNPLTDFDLAMCGWSKESGLPLLVLLTKADKLRYGPAKNAVMQVKRELKDYQNLKAVELFSSQKKTGIEQVRDHIQEWLMQAPAQESDAKPE
ncbi:MAG: YihA family ribosome biogenesis GTP-binding protein [Proteobacteria bacterium]|nr:MAG: YihA family ribosome biogenesis GTP-binding protein [Pseudomonadota bacterium]